MESNKKRKNRRRRKGKAIINSTKPSIGDINFDSKLEMECYQILKRFKIDFEYHPNPIITFESFNLNVPYLSFKNKNTVRKFKKIQNISYTLDFLVYYDNLIFYIEIKGRENEQYSIRKKLLLKALSKMNNNFHFVEIRSKEGLIAFIKYLKEKNYLIKKTKTNERIKRN